MDINTQELLQYVKQQKQVFKMLGETLNSQFNEGIIEGLNLVKTFVEIYENKEGAAIAEALEMRAYGNQG